jgi:geranylgeranyl diphosphate synthase, type I
LGRPIAAPASAERTDQTEGSPRFVSLLDGFRAQLEAELSRWLEAKRQVAELDAQRELIDDLARLTEHGGKRLRPALVYYTYRACRGRELDHSRERAVLALALATEFLHSYLLIHDDIMDHAETRRGLPSAHAHFRALHHERGLRGSDLDFGRAVAILLGDLAHSYAGELFASVLVLVAASGRGSELARCFAAMCEEVIGGQYQEFLLAQGGHASAPGVAELTAVLRLKSGRYTAERPIQLGALLAGAGPETIAPLSRYGTAMGEAFQLQDDLLGMFGDTAEVGKPVGGDLQEGKYTFLIHHALEHADREQRRTIEAALGNAQATPREIAHVQALLVDTGARAAVERMVETRLQTAGAALAEIPDETLSEEGRVFLRGLLDYLRDRRQ